jgi:hypothetical protein
MGRKPQEAETGSGEDGSYPVSRRDVDLRIGLGFRLFLEWRFCWTRLARLHIQRFVASQSRKPAIQQIPIARRRPRCNSRLFRGIWILAKLAGSRAERGYDPMRQEISKDESLLGQAFWLLLFIGWVPYMASYAFVLDPGRAVNDGLVETLTATITLYEQVSWGHPAIGILTVAALLSVLVLTKLRW